MSVEINVKTTRYITQIYWNKTGTNGTVIATLQIENGIIRILQEKNVSISRAEVVGERLLKELKAVYI